LVGELIKGLILVLWCCGWRGTVGGKATARSSRITDVLSKAKKSLLKKLKKLGGKGKDKSERK
jgi:hypothetical protein